MNIVNKEKILEQAKAFVDEGKLDRAIREYEKILLADPNDLRVKLRVAELYTKRKQVNDAIRLYREVADSYAKEGFFLKAVTVNKNILRHNPSLIDINEQLAILYEKMGLTYDAVRQYGILASTLDSKGFADKAIEIRAKIVALRPEDSQARVRLAEVYQREGKTEDAMVQYEELARQLEKEGDESPRIADLFEKILSHEPTRFDMMTKLIKIYAKLGENKKALKWLEAGGDYILQNAELLKLHAQMYDAQNQHESARTKYLKLAELFKLQGDINGALDAYYHILVTLPDEEERLHEAVEALRSGAMKVLVEKARKQREKIAADELAKGERDHLVKENGEHKVVEAKKEPDTEPIREKKESSAPVQPSVKPTQPLPAAASGAGPVSAPIRKPMQGAAIEKAASHSNVVSDKVAAAVSQVEKPHKQETQSENISDPKFDPPANLIRTVDVPYDLGMAYIRMGLADVAKPEFEKSRALCLELIAKFPSSGALLARKKKIERELGIAEKPAEKIPANEALKNTAVAEPSKPAAPITPEKKTESVTPRLAPNSLTKTSSTDDKPNTLNGFKREPSKKEDEGQPKPKRKVSFV